MKKGLCAPFLLLFGRAVRPGKVLLPPGDSQWARDWPLPCSHIRDRSLCSDKTTGYACLLLKLYRRPSPDTDTVRGHKRRCNTWGQENRGSHDRRASSLHDCRAGAVPEPVARERRRADGSAFCKFQRGRAVLRSGHGPRHQEYQHWRRLPVR